MHIARLKLSIHLRLAAPPFGVQLNIVFLSNSLQVCLDERQMLVAGMLAIGIHMAVLVGRASAIGTEVSLTNAMLHLRHRYHVLSYPGSGRTWLRLMLNMLGVRTGASHGEPVHEHPFSLDADSVYQQFNGHVCPPQFENCGNDNSPWSNMVLLLRDPLDIVVSNYYERKYRAQAYPGHVLPADMTLDQYVLSSGAKGGLDTVLVWLRHWILIYRTYLEIREDDSWGTVVLITYESLKQCPHHVLHYLLNVKWKLNVPCHAIHMAIANTTVDRMMKSANLDVAPTDKAQPLSGKIRSGRSRIAHDQLSKTAYHHARERIWVWLKQDGIEAVMNTLGDGPLRCYLKSSFRCTCQPGLSNTTCGTK